MLQLFLGVQGTLEQAPEEHPRPREPPGDTHKDPGHELVLLLICVLSYLCLRLPSGRHQGVPGPAPAAIPSPGGTCFLMPAGLVALHALPSGAFFYFPLKSVPAPLEKKAAVAQPCAVA